MHTLVLSYSKVYYCGTKLIRHLLRTILGSLSLSESSQLGHLRKISNLRSFGDAVQHFSRDQFMSCPLSLHCTGFLVFDSVSRYNNHKPYLATCVDISCEACSVSALKDTSNLYFFTD